MVLTKTNLPKGEKQLPVERYFQAGRKNQTDEALLERQG